MYLVSPSRFLKVPLKLRCIPFHFYVPCIHFQIPCMSVRILLYPLMPSFDVVDSFPMSLCIVHACSVDVRVPPKGNACTTACFTFVSGRGVNLQQAEETNKKQRKKQTRTLKTSQTKKETTSN